MGTARDPDGSEPRLGAVLDGKYRVDALLGEGGMGAVYRVHHVGLRRDLALKVLRPEITSHPDVAARFDREAWSAARLEHPNCLRVTDFGTTDGGLKYMVMELLRGRELSALLDGPLAPDRAVALTLQIVRGLEHAHGQGIVHRDIKPDNVFITVDHEGRELAKLVDFGIAKVLEGDGGGASPKLTRAGMVFGTPRYMSPEQAAGGEIDHRTDLYSVGIMLYQMLAGTVPFATGDLVKVLRQQIIMPPPPLPEHVPAGLRGVVERLLEKDRDDR
ncbi:MAG: serine/threonine protein kinase, partial [Myxococcales bacterium]|nr:serine/threonine protein kinase [Myxococcales bacterium]